MAAVASLPVLILKLAVLFLRYQRKRQKAGRAFRKSLVENGLPPHRAKELADAYTEALGIRKVIKEFAGLGGPARLF